MLASLAACALVVQLVQSAPPAAVAPTTEPILATVPTVPAHGRSTALTSLYVSFAALQGLDLHSTRRALASGAARESNPAMRGIVGNTAAMIAFKASTTGLTLWAAEKMRKTHPRAAVVFMAALNTAMAAVVAHNYSVQ